jgi:Zn-dependent metalloprotease
MQPSCFIVPPSVLEALSAHEAGRVAGPIRRTLDEMKHVRRHRRTPQQGTPPAHEHRLVYDCEHETRLPGTLRRREAQPPCDDPDVNRAYDAVGTTYDFYRTVFGRDSLDAHGKHLIASVHYGKEFDNASWDGAQMVYGDGDGVMFKPFTRFLDITAHELTHGIIYNATPLRYVGQAGALNESLADVFASLVKQWSHRQTVDQADWLIAKGIYRPPLRAKALRSLAAPGSCSDERFDLIDNQPAHMRNAITDESQDPVHANSGIPNHAFYLFAKALGGHAWETAGRVWYDVMCASLAADANFATFAAQTLSAAKKHGAPIAQALTHAWHSVGVTPKQH